MSSVICLNKGMIEVCKHLTTLSLNLLWISVKAPSWILRCLISARISSVAMKFVQAHYWKIIIYKFLYVEHHQFSQIACNLIDLIGTIKTSLNWSHNGSKNYSVDSLSRNRCQRPLTNCHTAETAGKWWRKDDPWPRNFPDIYLSIKWFQDVTNALFKRLAPLWIH